MVDFPTKFLGKAWKALRRVSRLGMEKPVRIDQTYQPKELPLQLLGILGLSYIHLYSCQLMPVPGSACET